MSYKEVGAQKLYLNPKKDYVKGKTIVEGEFLGEQQGQYGPQFRFQCLETDREIVLRKSGQLAYKLDFVRVGDCVKIDYAGCEILEKGPYTGKEVHRFIVLRKEDDTPKPSPVEPTNEPTTQPLEKEPLCDCGCEVPEECECESEDLLGDL